MASKVRDVMTPMPVALEADTSAVEAARTMHDGDFGFVIVVKEPDGPVCGVVTDRDITVRVVAEGVDPKSVKLADICEAMS
jgi:CBS domain-containing protein